MSSHDVKNRHVAVPLGDKPSDTGQEQFPIPKNHDQVMTIHQSQDRKGSREYFKHTTRVFVRETPEGSLNISYLQTGHSCCYLSLSLFQHGALEPLAVVSPPLILLSRQRAHLSEHVSIEHVNSASSGRHPAIYFAILTQDPNGPPLQDAMKEAAEKKAADAAAEAKSKVRAACARPKFPLRGLEVFLVSIVRYDSSSSHNMHLTHVVCLLCDRRSGCT